MSVSRKRRLAAAIALVGALIGGAAAAPANAACLSAELYTRNAAGTKQYLVGPKRCLVSTPYSEAVIVGEDLNNVPLEPGVRVWVPLPVAP